MNATRVPSFLQSFDTGYFSPKFNAALYAVSMFATFIALILYGLGVI